MKLQKKILKETKQKTQNMENDVYVGRRWWIVNCIASMLGIADIVEY